MEANSKKSYAGRHSVAELFRIRQEADDRRNPDGSCCQCGACCEAVLPLTRLEQQRIRQYLSKNPSIKKGILRKYSPKDRKMCPFLDTSRADNKCTIYDSEIFPSVCRAFKCPDTIDEKIILKAVLESGQQQNPRVDMWAEFFDDFQDRTKFYKARDEVANHGEMSIESLLFLARNGGKPVPSKAAQGLNRKQRRDIEKKRRHS